MPATPCIACRSRLLFCLVFPHGKLAAGSLQLCSMQGVWKARYGGPHGIEYISIAVAGAGAAPPPGCPVTSERLQGFKACVSSLAMPQHAR